EAKRTPEVQDQLIRVVAHLHPKGSRPFQKLAEEDAQRPAAAFQGMEADVIVGVLDGVAIPPLDTKGDLGHIDALANTETFGPAEEVQGGGYGPLLHQRLLLGSPWSM